MAIAISRNWQTQTQTAEISPKYVDQLAGMVYRNRYTEVSFSGATKDILILNTHATGELRVRFRKPGGGWNGKDNYTPIAAGQNLAIDVRCTEIELRGSVNDVTYRILATMEEGD